MNTLEYYFNNCTKQELFTIAKFHHMSGYSTLKKQELVERLADHLKSENIIIPFFSCLKDQELEFACSGKSSKNPVLARRLVNGGFCFLTREGNYEMPSDFPVEILKKPEFLALQKKNNILTNILSMAGTLYGCIRVSVLCELYKKYTTEVMTEEEMITAINHIPEAFNDMIYTDEMYIKHEFLSNDLYQQIQKCQDKLPYYIPEYDMMMDLVKYGYFNDKYTKVFADYVSLHTGYTIDDVRNIVSHVQAVFRQGGTLTDVSAFLRQENIISTEVLNKELMAILQQMSVHSRLLLNRGFTEEEKVSMSKSFTTKIYPNSPCPCGSGKKYKKCCGRR